MTQIKLQNGSIVTLDQESFPDPFNQVKEINELYGSGWEYYFPTLPHDPKWDREAERQSQREEELLLEQERQRDEEQERMFLSRLKGQLEREEEEARRYNRRVFNLD